MPLGFLSKLMFVVFILLPFHEPDAAFCVLVNEEAVLAQGEAAARDVARARLRVELDGVLLAGGVDEMQGLVLFLHDVQGNRSPFWRHCVVQGAGVISAHQGSVSPALMAMVPAVWSLMMIFIFRWRTMAVLSVSVTVAVVRIVSRWRAMAVMILMPIFVRGARMRMGVMVGVIVAAGG